jgi:hypothetical protein
VRHGRKEEEHTRTPHLWPLLLSLSLITLLRHHVPNITTALPDMPTSRQSHALPLPQPTRMVSWPPLDTACAPSPAYKRPPFLPEKTHTTFLYLLDILFQLLFPWFVPKSDAGELLAASCAAVPDHLSSPLLDEVAEWRSLCRLDITAATPCRPSVSTVAVPLPDPLSR